MNRPASAPLALPQSDQDTAPLWVALEHLSLVLTAGLVIARAMMLETVRDPIVALPGQAAVATGPGPVTILLLCLLAAVPAMIVLLRRALDNTFRLTGSTPSLLLLALALLAAASTLWASDRFSALICAAQLLSAAMVLWTSAQLVRDWARFRLGIALAMGLLCVFIVQGIGYRMFELPELRRQWVDDVDGFRTRALEERGWEADSYAAERLAQKVMAGEMLGNTASPNSLAATTVLLIVIAIGLLVHRLDQRQGLLAIAPAAAIIGGGWLVYYTFSNAAYLTQFLGAGLLAATGVWHAWMARHRKLLFAAGCALFVLGTIALIGHGLYHGSLPHVSLTFRWRYWLAAASMFADHPLLGVGYANFGNFYPEYRLAAAAEEIRDPHNLLVRFAVELGLVGGLLAVAWMAMLTWRFSRPKLPEGTGTTTSAAAAITVALAVGLGFLLNLACSIDFTLSGDYILVEVVKRLIYLALLALGAAAVLVRSTRTRAIDLSPAPWLVWSTIIALCLFLLHNLIDFAFFEAGPMHLFALLAGSVLGMRSRAGESSGRATRGVWLAALTVLAVAWVAMAVTVVGPVMLAEDHAATGDAQMRSGNARAAAARYRAAFERVPANADYAYRTALALAHAQSPPQQVIAALGQAIDAEPTNVMYRLTRARFSLQLDPPNADQALADFADAIALNPHDIAIRWEYARILAEAGRPIDAAAQAEAALAINAAYAPDESERLTVGQEAEIRAFIAAQQAASSTP